MSSDTLGMSKKLRNYMRDISLREPDVMARLRKLTAKHPHAEMQISPEQGQFMQMLVRMLGARRCIEIGTFTGYSALAVALALPRTGNLVACDISDEFTQIGRPFWEEAGVAKKIDLRLGPAKSTLNKMIKAGEEGRYDFAFIDADKPGYPEYFERCLKLLRTGGVIACDNIFMGGGAADGRSTSENAIAMRKFNEKIKKDKRVDISLVPIGDGLTLARKI